MTAGGIAAIITAAGKSTRMGGMKKELALLDGVPVLGKTVSTFAQNSDIDCIVITYPPGEEAGLRAVFENGGDDCIWIAGGESRQESVYYALLALQSRAPEYVLIHDAARPWITPELINSVLDGTKAHGACIPVVRHINAPKQVNGGGKIVGHLDRDSVVGAQTPQGFYYANIFKAHQSVRKTGREYPDDAEVYHTEIGGVFTVPGDPANRKITFRHDI